MPRWAEIEAVFAIAPRVALSAGNAACEHLTTPPR
jgi:hypothetical protein